MEIVSSDIHYGSSTDEEVVELEGHTKLENPSVISEHLSEIICYYIAKSQIENRLTFSKEEFQILTDEISLPTISIHVATKFIQLEESIIGNDDGEDKEQSSLQKRCYEAIEKHVNAIGDVSKKDIENDIIEFLSNRASAKIAVEMLVKYIKQLKTTA